MAGFVQPVLSAIHVLEHLVSEVQGEEMVYVVRVCSGYVMGVVFLLSFRRVAEDGLAAVGKLFCPRSGIFRSDAGNQRLELIHSKVA